MKTYFSSPAQWSSAEDGVHTMAETLRVRGKGGGGLHQRQEGDQRGEQGEGQERVAPREGHTTQCVEYRVQPLPLPRISKQVEGRVWGCVNAW